MPKPLPCAPIEIRSISLVSPYDNILERVDHIGRHASHSTINGLRREPIPEDDVQPIEVGKTDTNPCQRVKKFKLDNERYRFLTPTEEADLMIWLVKPREHLEPLVIVALGLGLRKQEQLKLRRDQVDFFRNVVVASRTKGNGRL